MKAVGLALGRFAAKPPRRRHRLGHEEAREEVWSADLGAIYLCCHAIQNVNSSTVIFLLDYMRARTGGRTMSRDESS